MNAPTSSPKTALPVVRIIGFSGHRQVKNPEAVAEVFRKEIPALRKAGEELIAMSSVAVGADTLFVREALRAGLKWIAMLPMPREIFRDDFTPEEWAEAEALLAQASEIRALPRAERPQGYVDCGKATVDESDVLLTLWDGLPARGPGGTAEIVAYARSIGREIVLLRESHLTVEKIDATQIPAAEHATDYLLRKMGPVHELPPAPAELIAHFEAADKEANRTAPNFRRATLRMSKYHLAATIVAGFAFALGARSIPYPSLLFTFVKTVLILCAFLLMQKLKWSHARSIWLHQRLIAEYCRSVIATWHCREFVEPISQYGFPEIRELARSALFLRLSRDPKLQVDAKTFRASYARNRVMHQYTYFEGQADIAEAEAIPIRERYRAYTMGALVVSVLLFVIHLILPDYASNPYPTMSLYGKINVMILDMLPLLLPAMASFALTRVATRDLDRRIGRYRDLQNQMHTVLVDLSFCNSWDSLSRTVERTEKILFHEVLEWYSIGKYS